MQIIYIVEALRFGDRESHSYFVGVFDDKARACRAAIAEELWRGGKYECVIHHRLLNHERPDVIALLLEHFDGDELASKINKRIKDS